MIKTANYVTDMYQTILRQIKVQKSSNIEENNTLARKAKDGDIKAREALILQNRGLVTSVLSHFKYFNTSLEKEDLFQIGLIGLIESIDKFDEEKGAFSTFATSYIIGFIKSKLATSDMIRTPHFYKQKKIQYLRLINENRDYTIDELCKILHTSKELIEIMQNDAFLNPESLQANFDDDDELPLESAVGSDDKNFEDLLSKQADLEILIFLKSQLSKFDYYIIYHSVLSSKIQSLSEIGRVFGVTKEAIRQRKMIILEYIKTFYDSKTLDRFPQYTLDTSTRTSMTYLKTEPISPITVSTYLYFKDEMPLELRDLYREIYFGKYKFNSILYSKILNRSVEEVKNQKKALDNFLITNVRQNNDLLQAFHKSVVSFYHTNSLEIDLNMDITPFMQDLDFTYMYWKNKSYDDFLSIIPTAISIPESLTSPLRLFFNAETCKDAVSKENLERKVNMLNVRFPFDISNEEIQETLLTRKKEFTIIQESALMCRLGKMSKEEFESRFPSTDNSSILNDVMIRFYKIYFNLKSYKNITLTRKRYLQVKKIVKNRLSDKEEQILEEFYRKDTPPSYMELKDKFNLSVEEVTSLLRDAREKVTNCLIAKFGTLNLDKDTYVDYLQNHNINLKETTRKYLEEFLINGLSYPEISKKYGVSRSGVSDKINSAIWIIDSYRFGLNKEDIYDKETLLKIIHTDFNKELWPILEFYINTKSVVLTCEKFEIKSTILKHHLTRMTKLYRQLMISTVDVSLDELENMINEHPTINIFTEYEKKILSLYFGFKNEYNSEGIKLSYTKIDELLQKHTSSIGASALLKAKEHKKGLLKSTLDVIDLDLLKNILSDRHVPLEESDIHLLSSLYGLNGYPIKDFHSIAHELDISESGIYKKFKHAIITVYKYHYKEIEGKICYEIDVLPYLKYFPKNDQDLLNKYYKDNYTIMEISLEKGKKADELYTKFTRLRLILNDIKNSTEERFDFDYFWQHVYDEDLPFFGDRSVAIDLFNLYYEENLQINEILKIYPNLNETTIMRMIDKLMIAVKKKSIGLVIPESLLYNSLVSYYNYHVRELSDDEKKAFEIVIDNYDTKTKTFRIQHYPNVLVKLCTNHYIDLDSSTPKDIEDFLVKYQSRLPLTYKITLVRMFQLEEKILLTDEELNEVLNFLKEFNAIDKKHIKKLSNNI